MRLLGVGLLLLLTGCASALPSTEVVAETVGVIETSNIVNNSLEWWQWGIIGMFIPAPWDMVALFRKSLTGSL